MSITFNEKEKLFCIRTQNSLYALRIEEDLRLSEVHYGAPVDRDEDVAKYHVRDTDPDLERIAVRKYREEYPAWGGLFFCEPALKMNHHDGVRDTELVYKEHFISDDGKKLVITMKDPYYPIEADLEYEIFEGFDLINRRSIIRNTGNERETILSALSGGVYLEDHAKARLTYMTGGWGREYNIERTEIKGQKIRLDSRSGVSNSHYYPYFALDDGNALEESGEVIFGTLQWSGNFKMTVERTEYGAVTVQTGINDFDFSWPLEGGASFETPVLTLGYSSHGFGGASRMLHDYQRYVLGPEEYANKPLPALYNSWCAFGFDIDENKVEPLASLAAEMGIELFVIDDGWFGKRDDENSALGDWYPSKTKFPRGLQHTIDTVHSKGLMFGIWVEPEMVNENSELYKAHPDWIFSFSTREKETPVERKQLVLNLAREDVRDYIIEMLDNLLGKHDIDYLKWDMNRFISQPGWSDAPEGMETAFWYTYVKHLHEIFSHIKEKYPKVIVENCASGGLRADMTMTKYCVRMNRSDNQDPRDELFLHEGFTHVIRSMEAGGAGHLSRVPNGVNNRTAPLPFRGHIGLMGSLGISIDLRKMTAEERADFAYYVSLYKEIRQTVQCGDLYRLVSPRSDRNMAAFYFAAKDKKEAVLFIFGLNLDFRQSFPALRLYGLCEKALYEVEGMGTFSGQALMNRGVDFRLMGDYDSKLIRIRMI